MWNAATQVTVAVSTSVALAIVWWVHRKYLRPLAELPAMIANLELVREECQKIKAEVQTNGGKSLKDSVIGIRDDLAILEARQRALLASSGRATFETDGRFNWRECNHAMERLAGVSDNNLKHRQWVSLIHEDDRSAVMAEVDHAVRDKRGSGITFRLIADGTEITVRMDAHPTFSRESYDVLCWFGTLVKVDDRRVEERRTV